MKHGNSVVIDNHVIHVYDVYVIHAQLILMEVT